MQKNEDDVFDRLVKWATKYKYMKWFAPVYARYKEFLLYALMGLGTVIIAIWSYSLFTETFGWNILFSNAVSWIFATLFAFFSNRKWVFTSHQTGVKAFFEQLGSFTFGRFLTLLLEEWLLHTFVITLGFPNMPVKYASQVIVIAANYFISKLFVFSGGKGRMHTLLKHHARLLERLGNHPHAEAASANTGSIETAKMPPADTSFAEPEQIPPDTPTKNEKDNLMGRF